MSLVTEELRAQAEICVGDEVGREKSQELLVEMGLPNGLLPLKDIEECGRVHETGFVWLKQKKKTTHKFEKIGRVCTYGTEITATISKGKIKKLTGVTSKELMVWVTIGEIFLEEPASSGKITFKSPTGLYRTFPVDAFVAEGGATASKELNEEEIKKFEATVVEV